MKVRKIKLRRALLKPRNPVAVALKSKRGGTHRKTSKALRLMQKRNLWQNQQ